MLAEEWRKEGRLRKCHRREKFPVRTGTDRNGGALAVLRCKKKWGTTFGKKEQSDIFKEGIRKNSLFVKRELPGKFFDMDRGARGVMHTKGEKGSTRQKRTGGILQKSAPTTGVISWNREGGRDSTKKENEKGTVMSFHEEGKEWNIVQRGIMCKKIKERVKFMF